MSSQSSLMPVTYEFIAPFDDADADLILRSSDNAYFAVYRPILKKASPIFADMFSIPQAPADPNAGSPIIDLSEDKGTILAMLKLVHAMHRPAIESLDQLGALMIALEKYGMDGAKDILESVYPLELLKQDPLRVYTIALRSKSTGMARQAAHQCLHAPSSSILQAELPDLHDISAASYQYLLKYHRAYSDAAASVITSYSYLWAPDMRIYCWSSCPRCRNDTQTVRDAKASLNVKYWWITFVEAIAKSLKDQPEPISRLSIPCKRGVEVSKDLMCDPCRSVCQTQLNEFLQMLQEQIEKAVAEVPFEPVF